MREDDNALLNKSLGLLAKSSLIVFVGLTLSKIFTYLYKIVVARSFNPEVYGLFNFALIIIGLIATIASFGMPEGILRFVSLDRKNKSLENSKYLVSIGTKVVFFTSIILGILLYLLADIISINIFSKPDLAIYLKIFSLALPFITLGTTYLTIIRAFERITLYTSIQNIFQNLVKLLALILFIFLGFRLSAILGSYMLSVAFVLVAGYLGAKKYLKKINMSEELDKDKKKKLKHDFFAYSWPIIFLGIASSLLYWIDSFVIGYYMSAEDLGFYNVAFTLVGILGIAPEIFMQLFFPMVLKEYAKDRIKVIRELSKQVSKWIMIINIPVFIIMILYPGAIINILFGQEYLPAENSLRILSFGGMVASIFLSLTSNLLSMKGKSKNLLFITLFIGLFNLITNIIFVPIYGLAGASFATAFSIILLCFILLFQTKIYLDIIPLRRKMLSILIVSLIPTIFIILIKDFFPQDIMTIAIIGILYLLIYTILIIIIKGLDKNDLLIIDMLKNKFN